MTVKHLRLTRSEPKESQVLKTVLRALELHPAVAKVWRMNTGAGKLVRASGASQWINFGFSGSPDIYGYTKSGKAIFCEVKRPSGVVTPEQQAFIQEAQKHGCVAFVARGADCVTTNLKESD
jgi:hypothetical protein